MNVGIYEVNGRGTGAPLYVELPEDVLPPGAEREVEEEEPGYFHEYPRWIRLKTGVRSKDGRIPIFLYREPMSRLNIDLNKLPQIKLQGAPYFWFDAHLIYRWGATPFYGRAWISGRIADALKIKSESTIIAKIRGYSFPTKRRITVIERYVEVLHMGRTYPAELSGRRWIWVVPESIEGYGVLIEALKRNYMPIAECNKYHGRVIIDFNFRKPAAKLIAQQMNFAFRNMSVRNYTATDTDLEYPFLCEIRTTYLTAMPKTYYQPEDKVYDLKMSPNGFLHDGKFMPLKNALEITIINILQYFFDKPTKKSETQKIVPYSKMSWAEHIDAIEYTKDKVQLKSVYTELPRTTYMNYETDTTHHGQEKDFLTCIKYVRVLNESSYKTHQIDRWVYLDDRINDVLLKNGIDVDVNGFVWENY